MATNGGRTGTAWNNLRAHVINRDTHCAACGNVVNKRLSGLHPQGPTVDHIIPLKAGGPLLDPANCVLMHRKCNERKGTDPPQPPRVSTGTPSRAW